MPMKMVTLLRTYLITLLVTTSALAFSFDNDSSHLQQSAIDLGPRPFFLINTMEKSALKRKLQQCQNKTFYRTDLSIGHRGAPMQFPEHTKESYEAAARMGAGIIECDVTFTADAELVCRHSQCDLHTTTNIVTTELNNRCSVPWDPSNPNPTTVKCCASDLTLAEFKTLKGKMDSADYQASTAQEFLGASAQWRTNLYTSQGTLLTHKESIKLIGKLGAKFTPELKGPDRGANLQIEDVFGSQQAYAQKMIDEYKHLGVAANKVWPQSFRLDDVTYWITHNPLFANQVVYLDGRYDRGLNPNKAKTFIPSMKALRNAGVKIIAPPVWVLLKINDEGEIIPSTYANVAKKAGLDIFTWTFERSDLRNGSRIGIDKNEKPVATWYYQFDIDEDNQAIKTEGDMYKAIDVLARKVKVKGIFSDWPATVTYYANCMNL